MRSIGILDSGLGGLTVYKAVKTLLPNEKIIYFGDTKNAPYGGREIEELRGFAVDMVNFLLSKNVKLILIACNTLSATSYSFLKEKFPDVNFIELIETGAISSIKQGKNIGVMATLGTVNSGAFEKKIKNLCSDAKVISVACPKLVPLIESGDWETNEMAIALDEYLAPLKNVDSLILGCTHYPIIAPRIGHTNIIDPAYGAAELAKDFLTKKGLLENSNSPDEFFVSKSPAMFNALAQKFLACEIDAKERSLQ